LAYLAEFQQTSRFVFIGVAPRQGWDPCPKHLPDKFARSIPLPHSHYARRQWIWFRRESAYAWVDAVDPPAADAAVLELLQLDRAGYEQRVRQYQFKAAKEPFEGPTSAAAEMRSYRTLPTVFADPVVVDATVERIRSALHRATP